MIPNQGPKVEALRTKWREAMSAGPQATLLLSLPELTTLLLAAGKFAEMLDDSVLDETEKARRIVLSVVAEKLMRAVDQVS